MNPTSIPHPDDLSEIQRRFYQGEATPEEWALLQQVQFTGQINKAQGDRSVAIGGNVSNSAIHTGDINYIHINLTPPEELHSESLPQRTIKVFEHEIANLSQEVTDLTRKEFTEIKNALREGKRLEANQWVKTVRENPLRWDAMPFDLQAEILRFNALLLLAEPDGIEKAELLADEAGRLGSGPGEVIIQARIAFTRHNLTFARDILKHQTDIDSRNLRAGLFLETGDLKDAAEILDFEKNGYQPNAETYRLRAISQLFLRNIPRAQVEIQTATSLAPKWESIILFSAIIDYYSAVSPAGLNVVLHWPQPFDPHLFLSDDESIERLSRAADTFKQLSEAVGKSNEERTTYRIWMAAALFGHPEKREAAVNLWKDILSSDPTEIRVITWMTALGIPFEYEKLRNALQKHIKDNGNSINHISSLIAVQIHLKNFKRARYLLDHYRAFFKSEKVESIWEGRQIHLLVETNQIEKALELIDQTPPDLNQVLLKADILVELAKKTNDYQSYINYLKFEFRQKVVRPSP